MRALELLLTPPPSRGGAKQQADFKPQLAADELAVQLLSGHNEDETQAAINTLVSVVRERDVPLPPDIVRRVAQIAADFESPERIRQAAQDLLRELLKTSVSDPDVLRHAVSVLLDEKKELLRLQFASDARYWLDDAVARFAEVGSDEDWQLLSRVRAEWGMAPPPSASPRLFYWPFEQIRAERRQDRPMPDYLLSALAGFAALVVAFIVTKISEVALRVYELLPLSQQLVYYVLIWAGCWFLAHLAIKFMPPASLFANRRQGLFVQTVVWCAIVVFWTCVIIAAVAALFENGAESLGTLGVLHGVTFLGLALVLVRPLSLAMHQMGSSHQVRLWVSLVVTLVAPTTILFIGIAQSIDDGMAIEANALLIGAPLCAALAVVFVVRDNIRSDRGAEGSALFPLTGTVTSLALLSMALVLFIQGVNREGESAKTTPLVPDFFLANGNLEHRLVPIGSTIQVYLPLRQKLGVHETANLHDISATVRVDDLSFDLSEEQLLSVGQYEICITLADTDGSCDPQNVLAEGFFAGLRVAWRAYLEGIERIFTGLARPGYERAGAAVPRGFARIAIEGGVSREARAARDAYANLAEGLPTLGEEIPTSGFYVLALNDVEVGRDDEARVIHAGSLVLFSSQAGDAGRQAVFVDGVGRRGSDSQFTISRGSLEAVQRDRFALVWDHEQKKDVLEVLEVLDDYLPLTFDPRQRSFIRDKNVRIVIKQGFAELAVADLVPALAEGKTGPHEFLSLQGGQAIGHFRLSGANPALTVDATVTAQLQQGWSETPNIGFCYDVSFNDSVLWLRENHESKEKIASLIGRLATARGVDDRIHVNGQVRYHCPKIEHPKLAVGSGIHIDQSILLPPELIGVETVRIDGNRDQVFWILLEDGEVEEVDDTGTGGAEQYRSSEGSSAPAAICVSIYGSNGEACKSELEGLAGLLRNRPVDAYTVLSEKLRPVSPNDVYDDEIVFLVSDLPAADRSDFDEAAMLARFHRDIVQIGSSDPEYPEKPFAIAVGQIRPAEDEGKEPTHFPIGSLFASVEAAATDNRELRPLLIPGDPLRLTSVPKDHLIWFDDPTIKSYAELISDHLALVLRLLPGERSATLAEGSKLLLSSLGPDATSSLVRHRVGSAREADFALIAAEDQPFVLLEKAGQDWTVVASSGANNTESASIETSCLEQAHDIVWLEFSADARYHDLLQSFSKTEPFYSHPLTNAIRNIFDLSSECISSWAGLGFEIPGLKGRFITDFESVTDVYANDRLREGDYAVLVRNPDNQGRDLVLPGMLVRFTGTADPEDGLFDFVLGFAMDCRQGRDCWIDYDALRYIGAAVPEMEILPTIMTDLWSSTEIDLAQNADWVDRRREFSLDGPEVPRPEIPPPN
ncbi:MAG: hypothetical protein NXH91_03375 [Phyllobacteriaceae bacterium]|nr:hypothetical protein [Phyllobacteriaceae bacterium]